MPSCRDSRRSSASSKSSHISREGWAHFSQTPRRPRRQKNVHRPANRSAFTNRRLPVLGSVSSHLISMSSPGTAGILPAERLHSQSRRPETESLGGQDARGPRGGSPSPQPLDEPLQV